jgi:hypothetical protein
MINLSPDKEAVLREFYHVEDARAFLTAGVLDVDRLAPDIEGRFASAFVRARKPETAPCCGADCCAG